MALEREVTNSIFSQPKRSFTKRKGTSQPMSTWRIHLPKRKPIELKLVRLRSVPTISKPCHPKKARCKGETRFISGVQLWLIWLMIITLNRSCRPRRGKRIRKSLCSYKRVDRFTMQMLLQKASNISVLDALTDLRLFLGPMFHFQMRRTLAYQRKSRKVGLNMIEVSVQVVPNPKPNLSIQLSVAIQSGKLEDPKQLSKGHQCQLS